MIRSAWHSSPRPQWKPWRLRQAMRARIIHAASRHTLGNNSGGQHGGAVRRDSSTRQWQEVRRNQHHRLRQGGPAELVTGRSVKRASASAADAAVCAPNSLSSTKAAGKIVVCDRGVVTRVEKSAEVKRVRGKGMVLVNLTDDSTDSDTHGIPTVHLNAPFGPAVKAYAKRAGATAMLR